MKRIPRNHDQIINILIRQVEKHHGRKVQQAPYNPRSIQPYTIFLSLTHLQMLNAYIWASCGGITDDTLTNESLDSFTFSEVRVGTETGTGTGYHSDYQPQKYSYRPLERIIDSSLRESFDISADNYEDILRQANGQVNVFVPNLNKIEDQVYHLGIRRQKKTPHALLRKLAKESSKILSRNNNDGRVNISIHDEIRRYVNSEGTVVRDSFFGYHFKFVVKTLDKQKRPMEFFQHLYFTENWQIKRSQTKILNFVENMAKEVEKRKDCPVLEHHFYPTLYTSESMAGELHECLTHMLASDNILERDSTVWGWENFQRPVANRYIAVYADPGMREKWGGLKWGSMEYDYEGIPAFRRPLIEEGYIKGYLADRNGSFHLSRLVGSNIFPGDARFFIENNNESYPPQPRISNLDIEYTGPRKPKNNQAMKIRFINYLKKHNLTGLYIPDASGAECNPANGTIENHPNFPYIVTSRGEFIPTKFINTQNSAQIFMKNIAVMGKQRKYIPHRCEDTGAIVRAGIMCGPGIVKNVEVVPTRRPSFRQY